MDRTTIELALKLLRSDDIEQRELGGTIYLQSKPTNEDIEIVNEILHHPPIMNKRDEMLAKQLVEGSHQIQNIL